MNINNKNFTNISDIFTAQAETIPDSIVISMPEESLTYGQVDRLICRTATFLYHQGIKPGDVLALTFENELTHIVTMFASARIGATLFSIPDNTPALLYAEMIEKVKPKILITDLDNKIKKSLPALMINMDFLKNESTPIDDTVYNVAPSVPWQIISGSGSTGKSKLIPITHKQEIARTEIAKSELQISSSDRVASLIGLHFSDTTRRFLETVFVGAAFVLFDPKKTNSIETYRKAGITVLRATVFHMEQLLYSLPQDSREIFGFLRILSIGTAAVSDDLRKRISIYLAPNLYVTYGTNETGTVSAAYSPEVYNTSGTVGRPFDGVEIEIVDKKDKMASMDEIGQIRIKSPGATDHYLNDKQATKKAFKNGWFYPGDLGKFTEDGQLIHLGRADHMMIMNGINIYPAEIEQIITSHPEVEDAAVMPIKSSVHQDIPVCAVVLSQKSKLTQKDLLEYTYQRLGARGPKRVIVLDTISRNEQGKLIRQELADAINLKLSNSSRGNTAAKKENYSQYTQAMQTFTIRLKKGDLPVSLDRIDEWLSSVLGIDIESLPKTALKVQDHVLECMWRILLLSGTLLQSIRVPLFDPGEIESMEESSSGHYTTVVGMVQIEHIPQKVTIKSLQTASNIILNFMKRPITPKNRQILFEALQKEFITPLYRVSGSGKSTMPILREAHQRNIPFKHLKNGVYQLGWGSKSRRMNRSSTDADSFIGGMMSHSKMVTAALLRDAGFPAPVHKMVKSKEDALLVAKELEWPLVVKPSDSDRGEGVTVDVADDMTLIEAFDAARDVSKRKEIIIERQVNGVCCRIFIADQKMLYAVKRLPKSIRGNGKNNVQELIDEANRIEAEIPPWKKSESFPLDKMALEAMRNDGFTPESVPKEDQLVPLRRIESTQWGGVDEDVTDTIHPDNIDLALRAAKLFGLHVSGIDIITADITVPWYENGAIVNEVNLSPLFGGGVISRRTIPHFLDDFIEGDGRIPITVIRGGADALERALSLQKEQVDNGIQCFVTSHNKSVSWTGEEVHFTCRNLYDRCRALLMDTRVEALILVAM